MKPIGYDYCLFCAELIKKDAWRDHMRDVHHAVLAESPKSEKGLWFEARDIIEAT